MRNILPMEWLQRAREHLPILILLGLGLAIGLWFGNDYGMTFDEERNAVVGETALAAYAGSEEYFSRPALDEHGPFYFMLFTVTAQIADNLLPGYTQADGRHLTHYLTFLSTVFFVYLLSLRLMKRQGAFLTAAFFATQPMLFGRGFINQKDTPFMAFFSATFVIGLIAADRWRKSSSAEARADQIPLKTQINRFWHDISDDFRGLNRSKRQLLFVFLMLAGIISLDLIFFGLLHRTGVGLIEAAYGGTAPWPIQALYKMVATDAYKTPLTLYIEKFNAAYRIGRWAALPVIGLVSLMMSSLLMPRLAEHWGFSWKAFKQPALYLSAILLGATICTRQLGIFVGGLVSLFFLYRSQARALFPLLVYWLSAALVTYATWPYLWDDPIRKFVDSILLASSFPPHRQFFAGQSLSSARLPWNFFPTLATIEHTEPTAALFVIGAGIALWRLAQHKRGWFENALLWLWFGVPLVGLIGFNMTVYGNLRHLLFILPPMFVIVGLAMAEISKQLQPRWFSYALIGLIFLPGIWAIIRLHPYEYIYKNSYTGGVGGAFGQYELDRECISLREAMEFVNETASPGESVMILRQISQVVPYARKDVYLIDDNLSYQLADYILACYFPRTWDFNEEGFERVYQVKVGSAVLTDVWKQTTP